MFPSKHLASWLPLKSFVSPFASPWLPFVRSQLEAKAFLTQDLKFCIKKACCDNTKFLFESLL